MKKQHFALAALFAVATLAAHAGPALATATDDARTGNAFSRAIDRFDPRHISHTDVYRTAADSVYAHERPGDYYMCCDFLLPKGSAALDTLCAAFRSSTDAAYAYETYDVAQRRQDQHYKDTPMRTLISYWRNGTQRKLRLPGAPNALKQNYMAMLVADTASRDRRALYAVVWWKAKKGATAGCLYKLYGENPAADRARTPRTVAARRAARTGRGSLDSDSATVVHATGNAIVMRYDGGRRVEVLTPESLVARVQTGLDFISTLGNIRLVFLDNCRSPADREAQAANLKLATTVVRLCKEKGALLTQAERGMVKAALAEMANANRDDYTTRTLGLAGEYLK